MTAFALDEYVGLAHGHPESYAEVVRRDVTARRGLDPARVHVPDGTAGDPDAAADRFEAAIQASGGIAVQLLGIGENGHIGFNEPGSPFDSRTRRVRLAEPARRASARVFHSAHDDAQMAITQGIRTILDADAIVLVALGATKAEAVARAIDGPVSDDCPASTLQLHRDVTFVLDRPGASKLAACHDRPSRS
ncbi:glucosamine-6-phosphate deaminase [Microbacterium sulfonylureivorans]|uniref:glucosamine-6-phosphate deaminase n=1 Tax=Microbacterium sulfonylureivorans TaxID=2486854 RepID=UPI001F0BF299|nr:glucosamine-6-phosphate deaminase [Microbacterium sulfonylureivorans]